MAERVGFEPTCPCGQDAFEAPPLRPLRYLSIYYFARWGPFYIPHLAARSRSPPATALRRSLATAGAFLLRSMGPLSHSPSRCALAVASGDCPPALACNRRRFLTTLDGAPFTFPISLRARGRLRRLPSGARLQPPALSYYARWGPFPFPISLRARGRLRRLPSGARPSTSLRTTLSSSKGRLQPPALSYYARWGPFHIPHLAARSRSPAATALRRSSFDKPQDDPEFIEGSLAAAGAFLLC